VASPLAGASGSSPELTDEGPAPGGVEAGDIHIWKGHAAHLEPGTQAQVGHRCSAGGKRGSGEERDPYRCEQGRLRGGEGKVVAAQLLAFVAAGRVPPCRLAGRTGEATPLRAATPPRAGTQPEPRSPRVRMGRGRDRAPG